MESPPSTAGQDSPEGDFDYINFPPVFRTPSTSKRARFPPGFYETRSSSNVQVEPPSSSQTSSCSGGLPKESSQSSRSSVRSNRSPVSNFDIQAPDSQSSSESLGNGSQGDEGDGEFDDVSFLPVSDIAERFREIVSRKSRETQKSSGQQININFGGDYNPHVDEDNGTVYSEAISRRRRLLEGQPDTGTNGVVMCIVRTAGMIGGCYYDVETGTLYFLPDMIDSAPDFQILRHLYAQCSPTHVITNSNAEERFLQVLYEICGIPWVDRFRPDGGPANESFSRTPRNEPSEVSNGQDGIQLFVKPFREFSVEECKRRILSVNLPCEPKDQDEDKHVIFISSRIPFAKNDNLIRAMGCVLKFLDKSVMEMFQLELVGGHVPVSDIQLLTLDQIVLTDDTAWCSLQIFSREFHPSSLKQGQGTSSSKEGLSVYSLLNQCITAQGAKKMRMMLLRPSRNREMLLGRYDTIEFCMDPNNMSFVKSVVDCLKSIKSIPKLLYRISLMRATVNEWKELYQTLNHCFILGEICRSMGDSAPRFIRNLGNQERIEELRWLIQEMVRIVDFEQSTVIGRIVSQEGLDPELDKKKKQCSCLTDIMSIVASEEILDLPPYVTKCCVVYIPEIGYLLAIHFWKEGLTVEELQIPDLEYRFKTLELAYYKSARMRELDVVFGDCSVYILEKETFMMVQLTQFILEKSKNLYKLNEMVSEMDCLISMASYATSNNLVRPILSQSVNDKLNIINGRHPLADFTRDFVPNSTVFRNDERVVIITGPNASGKSVYLKQVGVIAIMALCGSFVPAEYCTMPMFDKIFTRIHANESVSSGLSSFMNDLNQVGLALRSSTKDSLVIIDEFGKGTSANDGLSILTATVQDFLNRGQDCPHLFLSTHFFSLVNHLGPSPLLALRSMKFITENAEITYLFKLEDGNCDSSFAQLVAKANGMEAKLVDRALELEKITRGKEPLASFTKVPCPKQDSKVDVLVAIAEEFLELGLSKTNIQAYLQIIRRKIEMLEQIQN